MNENFNVLNLPDEMLHMTLMDGQAKVLLCRTTAMARKAAEIHAPSSTALAALSRTMTATAMMGVMMKDEDLGLKEPYIGQSPLVSGELGEDFAQYFTVSEQQPSLVALGCLVHDGYCLSAGGVLVQAMPGCSEELLQQLELRSVFFTAISREVADVPLEDLAKAWFDGLDMKLLSREPVSYQCDCSREKMEKALTAAADTPSGRTEKALIAMGRKELQQLIDEDGRAELTCHFCRTAHQFSREDLLALLERASR